MRKNDLQMLIETPVDLEEDEQEEEDKRGKGREGEKRENGSNTTTSTRLSTDSQQRDVGLEPGLSLRDIQKAVHTFCMNAHPLSKEDYTIFRTILADIKLRLTAAAVTEDELESENLRFWRDGEADEDEDEDGYEELVFDNDGFAESVC
jgi:hypothetical protein